MKITVVGTGYVGLVSGACLADVGMDVTCVDIDQQKIANLKKAFCPYMNRDWNTSWLAMWPQSLKFHQHLV